jgi:uncharacterized protein (TIGR03435 family)
LIVPKALSIVVIVASVAAGQSPRFEAVSIEPTEDASFRLLGGPGTKTPGLFTGAGATLGMLVAKAFDLPDYRLSGPDSIKFTRFNIRAKVPEGITRDQFRLMLQALLAERFKMTFHYQKKEMQGYDLVVAENGPKIKESTEIPPPEDLDNPPPSGPGPFKMDNGSPVSMAQLVAYMNAMFPVGDATGLKGHYAISLNWTIKPEGPSLFDAVQRQLGLKFEPRKIMVDVLVIDHIEKTPTEN